MTFSRVLISVLFFSVGAASYADVVSANDQQFGSLVKIDSKTVSIRPGCSPNAPPREQPWTDVRYVIFDDQCMPHYVAPPVAGIANCGGPTMTVYQVRYKAGEVLDASEVAFDGTFLRARRLTSEWVVEHRDKVSYILKATRCQSAAQSQDSWPSTACIEPAQWAVNWSPSPVAENQIFTKGFAIRVQWDGTTEQQAGVSEEDVRMAFQSALTLWTSALFMHRNDLDAELVRYVESVTSRSPQMQLVVAPQVVRVNCPQFAMALVNVSASSTIFRDRSVVALSQVQGRTTFLNSRDFRFFSRLSSKPDDPPVNLVAVMTHELGHAFGLADENGAPEESVMAGVQPDLGHIREPTAADVKRFAVLLRQAITGAKPGEFNAVRCAGLRVRATF